MRLAVKTDTVKVKTWCRSCIIVPVCFSTFPLWRLSGQWLCSSGPCCVIMVSLCDSSKAAVVAKV